jgi:hypothetical protein
VLIFDESIERALDLVDTGLRRLRIVDDLKDRGLRNVESEHDTAALDEFGDQHGALNVAAERALIKGFLYLVEPLELEREAVLGARRHK